VLALFNFGLMTLLAITVFAVPVKGSFLTLATGALLFVIFSTGVGLFASAFTRSQIAAMFMAIIGTMIPAIQFGRHAEPGFIVGRLRRGHRPHISGHILPEHQSRSVQQSAGFSSLYASLWPLLLRCR